LKEIKAFCVGDDIPKEAKFLFSKNILVSSLPSEDCGCHYLQNCDCREDTYKEVFYYELDKDELVQPNPSFGEGAVVDTPDEPDTVNVFIEMFKE
jgi:hypothetical protein